MRWLIQLLSQIAAALLRIAAAYCLLAMFVLWHASKSYIGRDERLLARQLRLPDAYPAEVAVTRSRIADMQKRRNQFRTTLFATAAGWLTCEILAAKRRRQKARPPAPQDITA